MEKDYLYLLEYDFNVVSFYPQPEVMKLEVEGRSVKHIPDFLVEYSDGHYELVEVKYRKQAKKQKYRNVARAAKRAAWERGINYRLLTEYSIRKQPLLRNCQSLFSYRERELSDVSSMAVRHALPSCPISLGDVCRLVDCNYYMGLAIIANRILKTDLSEEINSETLVIVNWENHNDYL
ncbi:TnsA endonuclease N-terminal domain-containing protein [Fodinicurvata halophila]|uniref:TnsA endonuclease N-terminal domain-containing protein n=1 Tax=Fodinicurvata halophila TaxID=1419723 RepID=A0ABV8UN29_9PROT